MNKKILLISALSVLALTGCQKSDTGSDQPSSSLLSSSEAIDFDTYTARAVTKSDHTPLIEEFNVEAFLTNSAPKTLYFPATAYKYIDSRYIGDHTYYWPANTGQHLDFYAVSPLKYHNNIGGAVNLEPTTNLTIEVTKTNGKTDIVAASHQDASYQEGSPVKLDFQHKLTKVSFTAVGKDTTKKYVISKFTLQANSTATYYFDGNYWQAPTDPMGYFYVGETYSDVTFSWTSKPSFLGTSLYLIPNQGDSVTAQIFYKVYDGGMLICDHTGDNYVSLNLPATEWGVNKNVLYALTIDLSGTHPIEFSTALIDWEHPTTVITVP